MNARLTDRLRSRAATVAGAALIILAAAPADAQDDQSGSSEERGYIVTFGPGVQANPRFPGADDLGVYPWPIVGVRRAGRPVPLEAPDEGFGFGLLGHDSPINIGPAINFQRRRREQDVGAPVGNVGWTVEAGGFVEAFAGENFRMRAEARQGIGGHGGLVGGLSADLFARPNEGTVLSIGPRLRWADNDYMDAYYGVTPLVSAAARLPVYDPGSGIYAYGATAGARFDIGGGFAVHTYARYDRLVNDAADSPIVARFGSRNQYGAGLGLSYSFRIGGAHRRD